ncbi:uncharacterized protein LOC104423252 [Eucalyptus grandis]|uniref:uncharacterized protein LOC104423252 n=1 Tax=Eucalyptus grandis TaxID=71139 RepID=UPI00192F0813|nr:uncharacterized protein LOC104423252 [Eucalyptus grandis]
MTHLPISSSFIYQLMISLGIPSFCIERDSEMAGTFSRGAQTMNSVFFKPVLRKAYHRKSSADTMRDTVKLEREEVKTKSHAGSSDGGCWVPHEQTGIYCPKGQEKVIDDVPPGAVKDLGINWISHNGEDLI